MNSLHILRILIVSAATAGLAACGGGGGGASTYTIGGTVTGLAAGTQIVLNDNGSDPLTVNSNAAFTFAKAVSANDSYAVTIATQPTGQTCSVANNRGAGVTANVTNVDITCSAVTYTIGGAISGLAAGQLVTLNNNGADALAINADGGFTFTTPVPYNGSYAVTVGTQPTGQTCTVSNGSGAGATADVASVTVNCSTNTFTIGGTVAGLAAGQQVTLDNNGADPVTVSATGAFTFATPVAFNGSYAVTAGTQPTGQTCTVANGSGSGVVANIANVTVTCSTNTFTIGGTVSGLAAGQQVTLKNNNADPKTVTANGAFTFATPVTFNGVYAVTVGTQPTGQTCTVANGSGSGVVANIANVTVTCSTNTFTIGGTVSGLAAGQQVTLKNNNADPKTVTANGAFTFATPVTFNGVYAVTVGTQPTGQTCTVANGSGSGVVANIANVTVTCSTNTFTIGGTVSGLAAGQQVTLKNNNADPKTVTASGAFTFATPVTFNGVYAITVGTQPTGQTCTVSNGSGSGVVANIANVTVACSTNTYTIGVTVSGLAAGQQVTLNNNGGNPLTVLAAQNGVLQTFSTPVTFNGSYAVTVGTQPTGQTCTVSNGSGSGVVANITNVTVACSTNTYTIGVTVSGLAAGEQVTLNNNGSDPLTVLAAQNGVLQTFSTPVTFNGSYAVTVGTQPTGQTCTVSNGSGSGVVANITNVTVACSTNTYTIGVTVSGLAAGEQVTLNNNGSDPLTVLAAQNGVLQTFSTPVTFNGSYAVTVGTQPTGQTCTVSNGSGSGVVANITNVTVACSTNTYTIGGTISGLVSTQQVTLNNNGGDPLIVTVASGGTFTFTTPVAYNTGYAVTVGTQPTAETCRITNGTGSNVMANVTNVSITCRLALAYVTNSLDNTVSQYTIGLDGSLTALATPIATGSIPNTIAVDPTGRFAYVANIGGDSVSQYTIGADGALAANGTATAGLGSGAYSIAIDSTGKYAYVTNQFSDTVSQFTIDASGALVSNGASLPTGHLPYKVTVDPLGRYVFVANLGTGGTPGTTVSQYTIGAGGALTQIAGVTVGSGPIGVAVNAAGTNAYVTNFLAQTISQFVISDATSGLHASVSLPDVTSGGGPYPLAITSDGLYAFWANKYAPSISQCAFGAGGGLDCSAGALAITPSTATPQYLAVDPFGHYVYTIDYSSNKAILQYTIGAGGVLTAIPGPLPTTGGGAFSIATTR